MYSKLRTRHYGPKLNLRSAFSGCAELHSCSAHSACVNTACQQLPHKLENSDTSEDESSAEEDSDDNDLFFQVRIAPFREGEESVEQDVVWRRCAELRKLLRDRPCLPLSSNKKPLTISDIDTGIQLPLYSCPWKECRYSTNNRARFLHHIAGGAVDKTHLDALKKYVRTT